MASFGYLPSRDNWFFSDGATDNQAWDTAQSIADTGRITDISAYFAGDTAGCTGGPVLWDSGNNVKQYTSHSVAQGTRGANGGFTIQTTGLDITFTNPTTWTLGAFRNSADSWVVPFADNVGSFGVLKTVSGTSPGTATSGSSWSSQAGANGGINVLADYFAVVLAVRRGGAWTKVFWKVRRGGVWVIPKVYVRRGGAWTQLGIVGKLQELDWKKEIPCIVEWAKGVWEKGLLIWQYDHKEQFGRGRDGKLLVPSGVLT